MAGKKEIPRELSIYINDVQVINSFSGITRAITSTNNEIKNLNKNSANYDADLKRLQTTLGGLKEKQSEFKEEISKTSLTAGEAKENISKIFIGLTSGNLSIAKEGLEGINGSIKSVIKSSLAFIATPFGATIAVLATIGMVVKQWWDYNESIRENTRLIENLTGKTGQAVANIRVSVEALADTFGIEFDQIAKAVDNLMDNGVAKNELEALDKIKNGLLTAPDKSEFLASLDEISLTAKQVGLDLDSVLKIKMQIEDDGMEQKDFFAGMQKAAKNLESQADALKTKMTDALGAGFTSDVLGRIKSGETSVTQALIEIGNKSAEIGLNQKQQMDLTIAVFGKAGMAAGGLAQVTETLTNAQNRQIKELTPLQKATSDLADATLDAKRAQDELMRSDSFNTWKTNLLVSLSKAKEGLYAMVYDLAHLDAGAYAARKQELINQQILQESLTRGLERHFEEKRKLQGTDFDFEKEKNSYIEKAQKSLAAAEKSGDEIQIERKKQALEIVMNFADKTKKINKEKTADEIRDEQAAAEKKQKLAEETARKKKEIEDKLQKEIHDKALALAKANADLAKAELNFFIASNQSKIDSETKLTDEIVAEETKRLFIIHNKKLAELSEDRKNKIDRAELEGKSAEEISALKRAIDLEYQTSNLIQYADFQTQLNELNKKYLDQQNQYKIEKAQAQSELELLQAKNKFDKEAILRKQAYDKEIKDLDDKLKKEKISKDQYDKFIAALDKKAKENERIALIQSTADKLSELSKLAAATTAIFGQNKASAISTAIINGGLAVTEILKTPSVFLDPYASIIKGIEIAGVAVTTEKQIAEITSAKAPQTPKFFYGGSTGTIPFLGNDEFGPVTGVVHSNEWVAPAVMTENPRYAATFSWLENERQRIVGKKYFSGGETTPDSIPIFQNEAKTNQELIAALNKLNEHLDKGIKASTNIGYDDVKKINDLNNERLTSISYGTVNK